jgi:hypothetical protein
MPKVKSQQKQQLKKVSDHKARLLDELSKAKGNISIACANTGLNRTTFYGYVNSDKNFAARVEDIKEEAIDHVESKLHELIDGVWCERQMKDGSTKIYHSIPDTGAVCFFLKCQAKKRGYIERQEITGAGGKDLIPAAYDLSKLSTAELLALKTMQDKIEIKDKGNE